MRRSPCDGSGCDPGKSVQPSLCRIGNQLVHDVAHAGAQIFLPGPDGMRPTCWKAKNEGHLTGTRTAAQYASDAVACPSPTVRYRWRYSASMQFNLTQDSPAGLDRLWVVFRRADYPQRKYLSLGASAVRVRRFRATRTAIEVELERDLPVDKSRLPPWMRLLARSKQTLQHRTPVARSSICVRADPHGADLASRLDAGREGRVPVRRPHQGSSRRRSHLYLAVSGPDCGPLIHRHAAFDADSWA